LGAVFFSSFSTLFGEKLVYNYNHVIQGTMRTPVSIFTVLLCCVLCLSDQNIALLASPRVLLVCLLLFWLRCEWCMRIRVDAICLKTEAAASFRQECRMVKENFELSQTVMHLSEQHELLCAIRNTGLKSLRYSRDAFAELRFPSTFKRSLNSSSPSALGESPQQTSPLLKAVGANQVLKSKAFFRRGSMSETSFSLESDWAQ
jgi:hypothetical protein